MVDENAVRRAISAVIVPAAGKDVVSLGMVGGLIVSDGKVDLALEINPADANSMEPVRAAAQAAILAVPGVANASVVLTAQRAESATAQRPGPPRAGVAGGGGHRPLGAGDPAKPMLPEVTSIVAVASGKGGVGKSTTAVNLAVALVQQGHSVGLLDADIYGPSMPRMLGIFDKPESPDGKTIIPLERHGLKVMSIGFMVAEDTAMIWRGPMVMGALEQMMRDVAWGALDFLIVDMPPGTGDAQLTMAQKVPLAGAVIVSTPQDIALADARRGVAMFDKVSVPVLGLIENMSMFVCPSCGTHSEIFGHGGAREEAAKLKIEFLGELPLHMDIRKTSDGGQPIVLAQPDSDHAAAYGDIARRIAEKLSGVD